MSRQDVIQKADAELERAERLLDVAAVARRVGYTTATVRNWIIAGKLKAERSPTGRYRIPLSELARIIKIKSSSSQTSQT